MKFHGRKNMKRELKKVVNLFIVAIIVFNVNVTEAFGSHGTILATGMDYNVRQETFKAGSVFVSRPAAADVMITNILSGNNIRSIEDYERWLNANISYKRDGASDEWISPEDMIVRRSGDCEDYAFLNEAILNVMGYETMIMIVGYDREDHAICVFKKDGNYYCFDNGKLIATEARTVEDFAGHLFAKYEGKYLAEFDPNTKERTIVVVNHA